MKISIVIPHLGRDHLLADVLDRLNNQSFDDFDVIIVFDEEAPKNQPWYYNVEPYLLNIVNRQKSCPETGDNNLSTRAHIQLGENIGKVPFHRSHSET